MNHSSAAGLSRREFLRSSAATATLTSLPILGGWASGKRGPASRTIFLDNDWLFGGKLDTPTPVPRQNSVRAVGSLDRDS